MALNEAIDFVKRVFSSKPELRPDAKLNRVKNIINVDDAQSRHLIQSIELEESEPPKLMSALVYTICGLAFAALIWAGITQVKETAIAEGKIIPKTEIQAIQHLEGGIISEIHVREGDIVQAGDLLLKMSPTVTQSRLDQLKEREATILLEMERYRAIAADREPAFDDVVTGYNGLKENQAAIFTNQRDASRRERDVLQRQLDQELSEEKRLEAKVKSLEVDLKLLQEELATQTELFEKGLSTRLSFLNSQRQESQVRGSIDETLELLNAVRSSIAEAQERIREIDSSGRSDALSQVGELRAELSEVKQKLEGMQYLANRLEISSPVDGIVQAMTVKAVNAVAQPGETMLEIVPIDKELMVEARINPADIGHVQLGQDVDIKLSSFDFVIYGSVPGVLERLSATTYQTPEGQQYYRALIKPQRMYVGPNPEKNRLLPGMVVSASVNVGEKSILAYLLKPLYRGFSQAFRER